MAVAALELPKIALHTQTGESPSPGAADSPSSSPTARWGRAIVRARSLSSLSALSGSRGRNIYSALLLEAAEIENRLLAHIDNLLRPQLHKMKFVEQGLQLAHAALDKHKKDLEPGLSQSQVRMDNMKAKIERMQMRQQEMGDEHLERIKEVGEKLSLQDLEITRLRSNDMGQASKQLSIDHALKISCEQVVAMESEIQGLRGHCSERLDKFCSDIEELKKSQKAHWESTDIRLFRLEGVQPEDTSDLSCLQAEMKRLSGDVQDIVVSLEDLKRATVPTSEMEEHRLEVARLNRSVRADCESIREQLRGDLFTVAKDHIETAKRVVTSNALAQMDIIRAQAKEDTIRVNAALEKLSLRRDLALANASSSETGATARVSADLDDLRLRFESQLQKHTSLTAEVQILQAAVRDVKGADQARSRAVAETRDLAAALVESQLLAVALETQDDQDRQNIALYGFKGVDAKPPPAERSLLPDIGQAATPRRAPRASPRRKAIADSANTEDQSVISVDRRCLSCSGSMATVMAGFKLACLDYAPGPVEYRKATYSRAEIIRMRGELLNQARERLRALE